MGEPVKVLVACRCCQGSRFRVPATLLKAGTAAAAEAWRRRGEATQHICSGLAAKLGKQMGSWCVLACTHLPHS